MDYKGSYIVVSLTHLNKTCHQKNVIATDEWDCYSIYKHVMKETGSKVGCFAGFYHHHLMTMSTHTHAYPYPLFEGGGLRMITLC